MAQLKDLIVTGPARFVGTVYAGNGFNGNLVGNVTGNLTGVATTATKLATARTISLSGSVTGSGSFDGSGNLTIATTTNHTHNYAGSSSAGGVATSAAKLATARTISLTGAVTGSGSFDGSGNLSITTTKNHTHTAADVGADPKGTAASLISNLINGAPETLDTLKEIADVITTNKSAIDTLNAAIGKKAEKTDLTNHINNTSGVHPVATTSALGFMSAADKKKLDGIASGANAYSHPSHTAYSSGLYKITVNALGHVTAATAVAKADITALGIPGSDTNTWRGIQNNLTSDSTTDSLSAAQGKVLKGLVDGKAASSHTHSYLPLAGGTLSSSASQIIRNGYSSSWINGRDYAMIRVKTISGYSPAISIKTTNGSWDIGAYDTSGFTDKLVFSYCTDANHTAGNNNTTSQITFNSDGSIGGKIPWDSVTGKPSTYYTHPTTSGNKHIPSGGSSGQILRWSADGTAVWGADNNTDTKVTQTAITASDYTNWRPLIWGASNSGTEGFTPSTVTDGVYTANTLSCQPSSGTIRATKFKGALEGNASSASSASIASYLSYASGNEINFKGNDTVNQIWFNYRNPSSGAVSGNTAITDYHFANRNGGTTGVTLHASNFSGNAATAGKLNNAGQISSVEALDGFIEASRFKYATIGAISGLSGTYNNNDGIILSAAWTSNTYGHQIYLDDSGYSIHHRFRNNGAWANWVQLIDSSNYKTYCTPANIGAATSGHGHSVATQSANGFMSAADKTKLDHYTYAHLSTTNGSTSGYTKININSTIPWMLSFTIRIYQNYRAVDIQVSGYNYGSNYWYSPQAKIITDTSNGTMDIKFGYDAANKLWVAVPASDYYGITIFDVNNGHQQISDYNGLFTITYMTSLTGTTQATVTAYSPWSRNETVTNSSHLGGLSASTSATKSTIVARDSNNYVYLNYINSNTSNSENPTISQIIVTNGSDHYYRKASLAHLKSALGSMPASDVYAWAKASTKPTYTASEVGAAAASHSHSYLPLAGGTMTGTINLNLENNKAIEFRPGLAGYYTFLSYQTTGNEALMLGTKNAVTSFMVVNGEDSVNIASDRWTKVTPGLQVKNNCVAIHKLIANDASPSYTLDVGGSANATTIYENGTALSSKYAAASHSHSYAASSHKHTKSEITDFPTKMPASDVYDWAKASTKPTYTYSEVGAAAASHSHSGYAPSTHTHTYTFDVSIAVADWATNSNGGYKCTKTVSGILATDEIFADVSLSSDVSAAKLQVAAWACVCNGNIYNSANNTVDFYCYDTKPAAALTIRLTVVR